MAKPVDICVKSDSTEVEKFAAEEMAAYSGLMMGREVGVVNTSVRNSIHVGFLPDWASPSEKKRMQSELGGLHQDGFIIRSMDDAVVIQGKTPRATLYGVYDYLRMLGARWYFPGKEHEVIPKRDEILLKGVDVTESPDMDHRSVVIYFQNSALMDWIDFAAKAKLNAVHLHWDNGIHEMPGLVASRGLDFGLRRHLFGDSYSPDDKDDLKKNAGILLDYVRALPPEMNEFFLWPADGRLKFKESGQENQMPLIDTVLMFVNEMTKALRTIKPEALMSFIDYASTWGVPKSVRPVDGVFLEIAPIQRCFDHALTDPDCPTNSKGIFPVIEDLVKIFDPATSHVLGYWLDVSLFRRGRFVDLQGRMPQIGDIIKHDLNYYKSKGISKISTFAVGIDKEYLSRFASPGIFHYCTLLWNTEADPKAELVDFCGNYYGNSSLAQVFETDEQIDPKENGPENWKALTDRFPRVELIVEEAMRKTTDEVFMLRLERLRHEMKHVNNWAHKMLGA